MKEQKQTNKWKTAFIVVIIIFLLGIGLIFAIKGYEQQYNKGIQYGINQTTQLFYEQTRNLAFNCHQLIVYGENNTVAHMIAIECLQNDVAQPKTLNLDNKTAKGLNYFCRQGETADDCIKRYETPMELKR